MKRREVTARDGSIVFLVSLDAGESITGRLLGEGPEVMVRVTGDAYLGERVVPMRTIAISDAEVGGVSVGDEIVRDRSGDLSVLHRDVVLLASYSMLSSIEEASQLSAFVGSDGRLVLLGEDLGRFRLLRVDKRMNHGSPGVGWDASFERAPRGVVLEFALEASRVSPSLVDLDAARSLVIAERAWGLAAESLAAVDLDQAALLQEINSADDSSLPRPPGSRGDEILERRRLACEALEEARSARDEARAAVLAAAMVSGSGPSK